MKKVLYVFCLLGLVFYPAEAQNKLKMGQLLDNISNVKVIKDYSAFKKKIEQDVINLTTNPTRPLTLAEYQQLKSAYNNTKGSFDAFLSAMQQDILDIKNVSQFTNHEGVFSEKYRTVYNEAVANYEQSFVPIYNQLNPSKSVFALLIPLGKAAFNLIVRYIVDKKLDNQVVMQELLRQVTTHFKQKLSLKPWEELVKTTWIEPRPTSPNNTDTVTTKVDYPVMKEIKGEIEFIYTEVRNPNNTAPMVFEGTTKSLRVGELANNESGIVPNFRTSQSFDESIAFQIKIKNVALLYVFAFNDGRECYPIYPFSEEWLNGFKMGSTKRLDVGPLMLQDENSVTTIPAINTSTGQQNYIRIQGQSDREELCIIISRSEINFKEVLTQINGTPGSLQQRISTVLSTHVASSQDANLKYENGKILFEVTSTDLYILPLTFEIRRK